MKAVIFAGGAGTRLWPLSRKNSPKQFEKMIGEKSTLQLAVERLSPEFSLKDIMIATNRSYKPLVYGQFPRMPKENIIGEPELRDVGPAVGLITSILFKKNRDIPFIILWSDHLVRNISLFRKIIGKCEETVRKNPDKIVFISQKPRYASQNLGWVNFGEKSSAIGGIDFYRFKKFHYRPKIREAEKYFRSGKFAWNIGYFVTTPANLWEKYRKLQPEIFNFMSRIYRAKSIQETEKIISADYKLLPKISFDNAILEHIGSNDALVVSEDLGWSDIGAWEALKEALQKTPEDNVVKGRVMVKDCVDSLVYNYEDKLVVTIGLSGHIIINTKDVVMVCHKNSVPEIKKLVEHLAVSDDSHLI